MKKAKLIFMLGALFVSISSTHSTPLIVNSNIVINGPGVFQYDYIQVIGNSTLTLNNCAILIDQDNEIFVDIGSKLIVDNSLITVSPNNQTPNYWKGIRVKGDFNSIQSANTQGVLILRNNAIIEKALVGISIGILKYYDYSNTNHIDPNWHNQGGGIVIADKSTIRNCMFGVVFSPYYNTQMQRPYANISQFTDMTFIWDKNSNYELCFQYKTQYKTHIELNYVHDIRFIGCKFTNTIKYHTEWWKSTAYPDGVDFKDDYLGRGTGIYAYGSSFFLHSLGPCQSNIPGSNCKECSGKENIFETLSVGINIQSHKINATRWSGLPSGNLMTRVEISGCYFHNTNLGINGNETESYGYSEIPTSDLMANRLSNIFINRCWFSTENNYYEYFFYNHAHDIYLSYTKDVEISDNTFIHTCKKMDKFQPSNHLLTCVGGPRLAYLRIDQVGTDPVVIRRNYFNDMDGSNEPCGKSISCNYFTGIMTGLILECNEYKVDRFNYYDLNGCCSSVHHDLFLVNGNGNIDNIGSPALGNGNIWSENGTYNYSYPTPYYRTTNNITINNLQTYQNFDLYYWNDDLPQYVRIHDGPHYSYEYSTSNAQVVKYHISNSENNCSTISDRCRYYIPYEENPNTSSNIGGTGDEGYQGTSTNKPSATMFVSPNPSSEPNVEITITPIIENGPLQGQIQVKDKNGNIIQSILVSSPGGPFTHLLDTSTYLPGIYFITYIDENGKTVTVIFVKG